MARTKVPGAAKPHLPAAACPPCGAIVGGAFIRRVVSVHSWTRNRPLAEEHRHHGDQHKNGATDNRGHAADTHQAHQGVSAGRVIEAKRRIRECHVPVTALTPSVPAPIITR